MKYAAVIAAALLAACAGASPPATPPAAPSATASWMSPGASSAKALLYVSDAGTFRVAVYSFPSLELTGTLTGFNRPQGECTDAAGNVWIANTSGLDVREYAHAGTNAIADLADPTGYPVGCAVNPATGDLAVANVADLSGNGGVLVYKRARGTPRTYSNAAVKACYFAAYDAKGNLYVSATGAGGAYTLATLTSGGHSLSRLTVRGGTIHFPGTVAWDGSSLVLGDQECNGNASSCLYRASVSGSGASITAKIPLNGSCDVAQAWIGKGQIAGADYNSCGGRSSVGLWPYPAGGDPTKRVTGLQTPVGATVSLK